MTPEEKELLMRVAKLSEDNNKILLALQKSVRWQAIWNIIKIAVIVVPLVAGYIFIQPYLNNVFGDNSLGSSLKDLSSNLKSVQGLLSNQ